MIVWQLAPAKWYEVYGNTRFREEAEKQDIEFRQVSPENFELIEPSPYPEKILVDGEWVQIPDILISRIGSGATNLGMAVIRSLQARGVRVLNSATSIERAKDKFRSIQALAKHGLPVPRSMLAKLPVAADVVQEQLNFPLILKPNTGSFGRGVMLCDTADHLEDILWLMEEKMKTSSLLMQEFISTSRGKDIRVLVIGGRPIGAMLRETVKENGVKANFTAGGTVKPFALTPELEWIAVESARVMGLDIAGVDVLFDKDDGYRICEVNSNPGFEGFEQATGVNVPEAILEFAKLTTQVLED